MKGVIMITGGGNGKVFAAIGATYPKGSTCTCSNKFSAKMIKGQTGTADGVFASVDTHITSNAYIPVVAGAIYTVNAPSVNPGDTAGENGVVFFKEDKSFLSHSTFGSETYVYFAAPADAAYMKLNFYVKTQPETMYTDITVLSGEKEKVLKAKNTSGRWIVPIPFVGTWTVTATNGTDTKSQSVSITTEGQWESVTLSYALILFDGADNTAVTGGWVSMNSGGTYTVSDGALVWTPDNGSSVRFLRTVNPVDFSKYKTLYIECLAPQAELPIRLYTRTDKPTDVSTYVASVHQPTTRGVVSIDLSAITTRNALYVGLGSKTLNGSSYYYNIYAEE